MECVICLDPLIKTGEELVTVRCGHLFHNSCLVKTLENGSACPICRKVTFKDHIVKIFINSDGALGECKECTNNKKELEASLEIHNKMVKTQTILVDGEKDAQAKAKHFEKVYRETMAQQRKLVKEKDTLADKVVSDRNEKQRMEAKIEHLKREIEKEKQMQKHFEKENKVLRENKPEPAEDTVTKERQKKVDQKPKKKRIICK